MTSAPPTPVTTYRHLLAIGEFRVLFLNRLIVMVSVTASSLALGTITFAETGSALLTGLAMFGGPLVSLVVSQLFLGMSDTVRPRTALMLQMGAALVAHALQAVPGTPWPARFALLTIPYVVNSMFGGTQWVVVRAVVPAESFVLARSMMNLAVGGMQVIGYGVGGVALLWLSPAQLFLVAAAADLFALVNVGLRIRDRVAPAASSASREGVVKRTSRVNRMLLGGRVTRPLYLAMWVPNGLVVGCEALFVPYAAGSSHSSLAGYLFAAGAAGMMLGDLTVGRYLPRARLDRLIEPLRLLLAAPFLVFVLTPPAPVALVAVFLGSVGYAASLPLQERLLRSIPDDVEGQAMGLYGTGLMVGQALGALVGGLLAAYLTPAHAMGALAVASLAVTLALTPGLGRSRADRKGPGPVPHGTGPGSAG